MKDIGYAIAIWVFLLSMVSCQSNQIEKNQGVFTADKTTLRHSMEGEMGSDNAFASRLLDKVIENAVIEFQIAGDSINGLFFLAGQSKILNTKIQIQNDSMVIRTSKIDAYLIPNDQGLLFKSKTSEMSIQMLRSDQRDLSPETKKACVKLAQEEKEEESFNENLGKWQKGDLVDEFGDKTEKNYAYSIVLGSSENSAIVNSEVYVKTVIDRGGLYFQLFNKSMTLKENLPDKEFGIIKIKFPSREVKNERAFFFENIVSESPDDKNALIYNYLLNESGELKILIDLSTTGRYYSNKYQFTISKNNLDEILLALKK